MIHKKITNCPCCGKSHLYSIKVEKSTIIKMETMDDLLQPPMYEKYTRLFECPNTKEMFQASISVIQKSYEIINSVKVGSIIDDKED